ncbi:topoisomerase II-associated-like protein [Colletotrichum incanum]|nr:topoisomerase II-associated-like protein [Colletotrichum incanum]
MAPNGNPKARNSVGVAHGKPSAARRVVPAIPLPLDRRVKANAAAKQAAAAAQAAAVVSFPRPVLTNGSSLKIQNDVDSTPPTPKTVEPEMASRADIKPAADESATTPLAVDSEGDDVKDREATDSQVSSAAIPTPSTTDESESTDKAADRDIPPPAEDSLRDNNRITSPPTARPAKKENIPQLPSTFRPPPVIPPTRYNMPPAGHNGARPSAVVINGTSHRGPRSVHNGPPHMHGPRPSNGSLQFGAFGSNSSSPAPPHSGGFMPPPGMPHLDGRSFPGAANGYHHQMPYGTEFVPGTAVDGFGRPLPGYTGLEQYGPHINGYGPSTPHSFQGSHSSAHADEPSAYNHYPAPGVPNGNAQVDDARPHPPPAGAFGVPPQRMMPGPIPPPHMMHPGPEHQGLDDMAAYLRSQFGDTAFADCTLELRYLDDRAPPVRLPGHRLVLARSQTVRNVLESDGFESSPPGANRTILLQSDDRSLRSDAFWMAVQHLYAFPLLDLPEPTANGAFALAGSADDRFDFALGYAAAGHLLGWQPIVIRGLEIASQSLSWSTIERALEFALGDVPSRASADRHTQFIYGEPVQILMNGIISFLINNFPPDFTLDTSVADPERFARIPYAFASSPAREGMPTIARGTANQDRRTRPMHIQFGDLAVGSDSPSKGSDSTPQSSQQRSIRSILSTILINLPFAYLKPALESSGYGNVNGWASIEARHQIMRAVVNEREARRSRAIDAVRAGAVPHAESILYGLQSVEPRQSEEWHGLGWRENVVSYVNGDAPSLGRQWAPLMVQPNGVGHVENMSQVAYP